MRGNCELIEVVMTRPFSGEDSDGHWISTAWEQIQIVYTLYIVFVCLHVYKHTYLARHFR